MDRISDGCQNKEVFNENVTSCDPTINSKIPLKTISDTELPKTSEQARELEDEVSKKEEVPKPAVSAEEAKVTNLDSNISIESVKVKVETNSDSEFPEDDLDDSEATDRQTVLRRQQERIEEDELFNKHFSMVCDRCETTAATFTELQNHFLKEHSSRFGYVTCCSRKLSLRCTIRDHIRFHADPDVFRCEVCEMKYKNRRDLNRHVLRKHSNNQDQDQTFKCEHCSKTFPENVALVKHMRQHVKVKCSKCGKLFAHNDSLNNHMKKVHGEEDRAKVCDTCGKVFRDKQCFDRHVNDHKGIGVQRVQCKVCHRWLKNEQSHRDHMEKGHIVGGWKFT